MYLTPSLSLVGKTVIDRQAVLLALDHRLSKPSQDACLSGILWIRSLLQWRDRAGVTPVFPIKPLRAPISTLFNCPERLILHYSFHNSIFCNDVSISFVIFTFFERRLSTDA